MNKSRLFAWCLIFLSFVLCQGRHYLTVCVIGDFIELEGLVSTCRRIQKLSKKLIDCSVSVDRIGCLEKLMNGKADFAVLKAEDFLMGSFINNQTFNELVVTNEFRAFPDQKYEFDMVVLVSNEAKINSLSDLRSKRLCHPGYDENGWLVDWTEVYSQYFEETIVPMKCDPNKNVIENKLDSLHSFFGNSCKPGQWSPEISIDRRLKQQYRELCSACGIPSGCSQKDVYWGRTGPLMCLMDCRGDVAWVRLKDARLHLKTVGAISACHNMSFLCPNGEKLPFETDDPCIWISHPWPMVVARKSESSDVANLISLLNNSTETYHLDTWEYLMRKLLNPNTYQPVYSINPTPASDYLRQIPGFLDANSKQECGDTGSDKTINICASSKEALKQCQITSQMANLYSINPTFRCIGSDDCLSSVENNMTDVAIVGTDDLRNAYKKKKLKTILYQTHYDFGSFRYMSAVVLKKSNIRSITDLTGKKACFMRENGLGWNAFLLILQENKLIDDICFGRQIMKNFFSDICIINSKPGDSFRTCFPDELGYEFDSKRTNGELGLKCITDGGGDVAFLDYNALDSYVHELVSNNYSISNFRQICPFRNSSSQECYLAVASYGQVLIKANTTQSREEEIISAFLLISNLFGEKMKSGLPIPTYKMFERYQLEENVLFESEATMLETVDAYLRRASLRPRDYERSLKYAVDACQSKLNKSIPNTSVISYPVISIYLYEIFFIIYIYFLYL